jgi:hypothetical protein
LTPTELAMLTHGEAVGQRLDVESGGGWEIRVAPSGGSLGITWEAGVMVVSVPPKEVARLAEPDREGVYAHRPGCRLLVEKDFPCAHPHAAEAEEPDTERFAPTADFLERKGAPHS